MEISDVIGQWTSNVFTMTLRSENFLILKVGKDEHKGLFSFDDNLLTLKVFSNGKITETLLIKILSLNQSEISVKIISPPYDSQIITFKKTFFDIDLIKIFDFDEDHEINISSVKKLLQIEKLLLNTVSNRTDLLRHWENKDRFAVEITKSVFDNIKSNKDFLLSIYSEIRLANLGYYTNFTIEKYVKPFNESYTNRDDFSDRYSKYNGAYGYDDYTIDSAFEGNPDNIWNID